jgi:cobalt-zinc-cadmium efflux system protein
VHAHGHGHGGGRGGRALAAALVLVAGFAVVEVVVGVLADSLALLADAAHMAGDTGALALAVFAVWIARRPATPRRSFGYRRAEILAALANGVMLVALAIWIFVEAAQRLADPPDPDAGWVLVVGALGLAVNVGAALVLHGSRGLSLNVEAAFRHVLADLAGSAGVIVSALIVLATGWAYADPLVGLAIGLLVLASSWTVLRDSTRILLEAAPSGVDADEVGRAMLSVEAVRDVHDLHVWTITSGFPALSAHVLCDPGADCHRARRRLEALLRERFGLTHTTLQVDHVQEGPQAVELGAASPRTTPVRRREH